MNFEKIDETNCRIDNIENGDLIPIGGSFVGKLDLKIKVDEQKFANFFEKVALNAKAVSENEAIQKWLKQVGTDIDPKLFAQLYALNGVMRAMYPNMSDNFNTKRQGFYDVMGSKSMSDAFEANVCACAEMTILSQLYLQKQGIDSQYFGGELLRNKNEEFGEAHSFVWIKEGEKEYIFDPANPNSANGIKLPKIASIEVTKAQKMQFENKIHSTKTERKCAFLETKDILSGASWYYGCGDGANIFEGFIISKDNNLPIDGKQRD